MIFGIASAADSNILDLFLYMATKLKTFLDTLPTRHQLPLRPHFRHGVFAHPCCCTASSHCSTFCFLPSALYCFLRALLIGRVSAVGGLAAGSPTAAGRTSAEEHSAAGGGGGSKVRNRSPACPADSSGSRVCQNAAMSESSSFDKVETLRLEPCSLVFLASWVLFF